MTTEMRDVLIELTFCKELRAENSLNYSAEREAAAWKQVYEILGPVAGWLT